MSEDILEEYCQHCDRWVREEKFDVLEGICDKCKREILKVVTEFEDI